VSERDAVVGGGMLGMVVALRLAQAGRRVTLFESAPSLGGLADAWNVGPLRWDRHYHVTLLSDRATRALAAELGIDDYRWVTTRTGFYTGGRLYSMSDVREFLRFPPLRLGDKLRLAATILYAARIRDGERLERIAVEPWLRRLSGDRTTEKIWLPLLRAKLGTNVSRASAAFLWAIVARMYAARRSGLKTEMFGYAPGGYGRIVARLGSRLTELGVDVRCATPVERVRTGEAGVTVGAAGAAEARFDRAVVTAAAPLAARLCPQLSEAERMRLESFTYQGVICASAVLRRPLAGFYVTNLTDPQPFSAVIEMTALVDPADFGGRHLIYLPKYVPSDDPAFEASDEALEAEFSAALFAMYPGLTAADVVAFRIARTRFVLPVATLHYSRGVPPLRTSLPGVWLVNSTQIVNGTLNVNETIQLAERAVAQMSCA
jgi:protoporphyrinogen oxidase